jgi:predicted trehalose synthase
MVDLFSRMGPVVPVVEILTRFAIFSIAPLLGLQLASAVRRPGARADDGSAGAPPPTPASQSLPPQH